MATTPFVLGADIGSGAARVAAVGRGGDVLADAAAEYPGQSGWPAGRARPETWLRGLESALEQLPMDGPASALAIGGQSPTTVAADGGWAVTCSHPAGADLPPDEQHAAQWELLRHERDDDVVPCQVWDWLLQRLGAPQCQGRWPGEAALPGYGHRVDTATVVGRSDGTHGVAAGTPLVPAAQDAYLSFWAGGLDEPGRGLDPGGRTGGLGVAVEAGRRPSGLYALPSAAAGIDVVGGPTAAHGAVIEWWSRVTGRTIAELLELAVHVAPGAGGVIALPYLEGERAPRWDPSLRAHLAGISGTTGPGDVCRALLEGTAYGLAHIADVLAGEGVELDRLLCGGSPARSRLWCSIKASVLETPVEVPAYPELTAYGAALAAGAALEWWPPPGKGRRGDWPRLLVDVIDPEPNPVYRAGYARFVALGDLAAEWTRTKEATREGSRDEPPKRSGGGEHGRRAKATCTPSEPEH
jgi:sugar (pentulose or hexulose) kinase